MPFANSCFISYPHSDREEVQGAYRVLEMARHCLEAYLDEYFKHQRVYFDETRLKPGAHFKKSIARDLCRSVCMVVFFLPKYKQSDFCLSELRSMLELERERYARIGKQDYDNGLIIPIILRGKRDHLPEEIRDTVHCCDMSLDMRLDGELNLEDVLNERYGTELGRIAEYIYDRFEELSEAERQQGVDLSQDCSGFRLAGLDLKEGDPIDPPVTGAPPPLTEPDR